MGGVRTRVGGAALVVALVASFGCASDGDDGGGEAAGGDHADSGGVTGVVPARAEVQALLDRFREEHHAFGMQLGVRVPGEADLVVASGVDDGIDGDPVTPMPTDGTYPVASITKTFTSALVLQLVEEGRLSLDDTLDRWLPDYPYAADITVRQMLDMTSGIADREYATVDGTSFNDLLGADMERRWTLEEVVAENATVTPYGPPGEENHYSSGNYWVLGYIIEQVTGQAFADALDERILTPYALDETSVNDGTTLFSQHGWTNFGASGDPSLGTFDPAVPREIDIVDLPRPALATFETSSASIVSSTRDLLEWGELLYGGAVLGDQMNAELLSLEQEDLIHQGDTAVPSGLRYGLGVTGWCPCDPEETPNVSIVGHHGSMAGDATLFARDVATGVVVVIRANVREVAQDDRDQLMMDALALTTDDR